MSDVKLDYYGRPVPAGETPDTLVQVWEIAPHIDTSYDSAVTRNYYSAVDYAQRVVEHIMDDPEREYPATVTIRQLWMKLSEYEEMEDA